MKKKSSLILGDEFLEYCELNKIGKVNKLARETFDRGFTILKYGETPSFLKGNEVIKEVEKEIIKEVEKIIEVEKPIEIIKEVEKIIEVEKPIEVIVEKEVYITDDEQVKDLGKKITKLEKDKKGLSQKITALETKLKKKPKKVIKEVINDDEVEKLKEENKKLKEELEKITSSLSNLNKAKYIKNSNLNSLYDE
jgi:predicted RNase H-like nuclease (RuvC/YqgF family)